MKDVIVLFERMDLQAASILKQQYPSAEIWVFDPHLLDTVAAANLQNGRYIHVPLDIDSEEFVRNNQLEAIRIEENISKILQKAAPAGHTTNYWQHLSWHFLLATLRGYQRLWDRLIAQGLHNTHLHVPVFDLPATFYLPSFLPAVLLMERLSGIGIPFSAYLQPSDTAHQQIFVPTRSNTDTPGKPDLFLHLPTCMYDADSLRGEVIASGRQVLNIPSQHWNVPMQPFAQSELVLDDDAVRSLPPAIADQVESSANDIDQWLQAYFCQYLATPAYTERQARRLARQYRAQLIFLHHLDTCHASSPPTTMVLSNHDAGLHGPLLSFAEKHSTKVVIVPHAKITNFQLPTCYSGITSPVHPIQGGHVTNLRHQHISSPILDFRETLYFDWSEVRPLSSIGVVLNKFSMDGISIVDANIYANGLRKLQHWCRERDIHFFIRGKPQGTCLLWLGKELGLSIELLRQGLQGSMSEFAKSMDLCLMYDAPTSGAAELLRNGVPLLAVLPRRLAEEENNIVSSELVPQYSIDAAIKILTAFFIEPTKLSSFRKHQFAQYVTRTSKSIYLRDILKRE